MVCEIPENSENYYGGKLRNLTIQRMENLSLLIYLQQIKVNKLTETERKPTKSTWKVFSFHVTCFSPFLFQDLEAYALCYTGLAKVNRLLFVAKHCPPYKTEALRMALAYTLSTYNTQMYQLIHRKLNDAV